jgi:hypothetical protein
MKTMIGTMTNIIFILETNERRKKIQIALVVGISQNKCFSFLLTEKDWFLAFVALPHLKLN